MLKIPETCPLLELVWEKVRLTATAGHQVVLLLEDPVNRDLEKSTRTKLQNLNGV